MKKAVKKVETDTLKKYEKIISTIQLSMMFVLFVLCMVAIMFKETAFACIFLLVGITVISVIEIFLNTISKEIVYRNNEHIINMLNTENGSKISIKLKKHHEDKVEYVILEEMLKKCEIQGKYNEEDDTISFVFIFNNDTCEIKLDKQKAVSHIQNL